MKVGDDEVGPQDCYEPDGEIEARAERHGGLMPEAESWVKYEALKIPAGPSGRDCTVRRV